MQIIADSTEDMIKIVAGLVKEGIRFESERRDDIGCWIITCTGGF